MIYLLCSLLVLSLNCMDFDCVSLSLFDFLSLYCLLGALGSSSWAKGFPRLNKIPIAHIPYLMSIQPPEGLLT